jgi:hypothetical protein
MEGEMKNLLENGINAKNSLKDELTEVIKVREYLTKLKQENVIASRFWMKMTANILEEKKNYS